VLILLSGASDSPLNTNRMTHFSKLERVKKNLSFARAKFGRCESECERVKELLITGTCKCHVDELAEKSSLGARKFHC
jgi:hypothetical protein